eukprot:CAMPEP_0117640376 /NCGR_PEP_ID=MMETSP0802-20121206/8811_1 /TAXON_ID=38833 /ORGANISM="Micromonas sp., Strain CCMP2099" /LENGTH=48 /DNA_ID= /DNA_START= /DNA_END= /DNA_ORIENTATION=
MDVLLFRLRERQQQVVILRLEPVPCAVKLHVPPQPLDEEVLCEPTRAL